MDRTVSITVKERVWKKLNQLKEAGDTLSDVIERNLQNEDPNK